MKLYKKEALNCKTWNLYNYIQFVLDSPVWAQTLPRLKTPKWSKIHFTNVFAQSYSSLCFSWTPQGREKFDFFVFAARFAFQSRVCSFPKDSFWTLTIHGCSVWDKKKDEGPKRDSIWNLWECFWPCLAPFNTTFQPHCRICCAELVKCRNRHAQFHSRTRRNEYFLLLHHYGFVFLPPDCFIFGLQSN